MKVWITRDYIDTKLCCGIFENQRRPLITNGCYRVSGSDMTIKRFVKRYGFAPEKGSCKQMELTLKEIE